MNNLNNKYTLYAHLPNDSNWDISSYKVITNINILEEMISLNENIPEDLIQKCMFFLMKDNIKPMWEDENNKKGGSISYKINNDIVYNIWKNLTYYLISDNIMENSDNITGISISPKKNFCIIKLWLRDCNDITSESVNKEISLSEVEPIIRCHV